MKNCIILKYFNILFLQVLIYFYFKFIILKSIPTLLSFKILGIFFPELYELFFEFIMYSPKSLNRFHRFFHVLRPQENGR